MSPCILVNELVCEGDTTSQIPPFRQNIQRSVGNRRKSPTTQRSKGSIGLSQFRPVETELNRTECFFSDLVLQRQNNICGTMKRVGVLGCGAWATAVSRLIADNVKILNEFNKEVKMFVHDEMCGDKSLSEVINSTHVNEVYLPGVTLPENVVASCDIDDVVSKADVLAVAYPSRYVPWLLERIQGGVKESAYFITFTKGLIVEPDFKCLRLVSDLIREKMKRPCVAVIGATTALEVVSKHFTEATIGSTDVDIASEVKRLLTAPYFRLTISKDEVGVELCGAMKNVIAIAAGVSDGLNLGDNTKSAVIRLGFWEMFQLMKELFPNRGVQGVTLEESCGVAELVVCMSHRSDKLPALGSDMDLMNIILGKSLATKRRLSEGSVTGDLQHPVTFVDGAEYAHVIYNILKARNRLDNYPLFVAVHEMCQGLLSPHHFLDRLRSHPVHR